MHTKNDCIFYQFNLEIDRFIIPEVIFKNPKKSHKALFALENFLAQKGPYATFLVFQDNFWNNKFIDF